jgi:hypothetical protein
MTLCKGCHLKISHLKISILKMTPEEIYKYNKKYYQVNKERVNNRRRELRKIKRLTLQWACALAL